MESFGAHTSLSRNIINHNADSMKYLQNISDTRNKWQLSILQKKNQTITQLLNYMAALSSAVNPVTVW